MATDLGPTRSAAASTAVRRPGRSAVLGLAAFVVVATAALLWSKWWPYTEKAHTALVRRVWTAPTVLDTAGRAGDGPSLQGGWDFTVAYGKSVWKAWLAGLVIAAAASALVRRDWLLRALGRDRGRVFALAAVVERLAGERPDPAAAAVVADTAGEPARAGQAFLRRLVLLAVILTPLYFVLTFLEGTFRGWVFPLDGSTAIAAAVVVAVVLGTIVDLPTTGEIPIVLALAAAGMGAPVIGALLLTLPAISLGTMVLIRTAHGTRTTALAGAAVAVTGLAGAVLLPLLGG